MIFKRILMFIYGFYRIKIEGMYIQRFINLCASKSIIIHSSKIEKSTILNCKILKDDLEEIKEIADKVGCIVEVQKENGIPFLVNKYKKRKWFAVAVLVIAFFIYFNSLFIWNIEINLDENKNLSKNDIVDFLENNNIKIGNKKDSIIKNELKNQMCLKFENISWIGIEIKGTNLIINIEQNIEKEDVEDDNNEELYIIENNNIISNKSGMITKITIFSGTARKSVGDSVAVGDLLVEGVMEGKYTGQRTVKPDGEIIIQNEVQIKKTKAFKTFEKEKTGNVENKVEIYINNFKINFNKTLLKFQNYDTIRENRKIKLFSNYYIPVTFSFLKNEEWNLVEKIYTREELEIMLADEIEKEFESKYDVLSFEKIDREINYSESEDGLTATAVYKVQEKIRTK